MKKFNQFLLDRDIPIPKDSPQKRQQQRMRFRNFLNLRQAACAKTCKALISMYPSDAPFPVVHKDWWWSDCWDARDYGREFDFTKPFFTQYAELNAHVPRASIVNVNCENSEYANFAFNSRNCYLVFGCVENEDCLNGHIVWMCKDCVDCLYAYRSTLCSNSIDILDCYESHYCIECSNCQMSYFCRDCIACQNCFGSFGLRNKQYYWFNEACSKDEYEARLKKFLPMTRVQVQAMASWLGETQRELPYPHMYGLRNEEVTGNHIYDSKDCTGCFDLKHCEQCENCFTGRELFNCYDCSFMGSRSLHCYNNLTLVECEEVHFSHQINFSHSIFYSEFCVSSRNLFGCNGIRRGNNCILNKEYSTAEYEKLVKKVISHMKETGEWGMFFPEKLSPFEYSYSIANEYMPIEAELSEASAPKGSRNTPEYIELKDAPQGFVAECAETGKAFRILPREIVVSRESGLPLPNINPITRHKKRMAQRAPRSLQSCSCKKCNTVMQSANSSMNQGSGVLCEQCYEMR